MSLEQIADKVIETDVLVIGAGYAGCWGAIAAREEGAEVVVVDKSFAGKSGASTFGAGVILTWMPGDDLEAWVQELSEFGDYLNDQEWLRILLTQNWDRIQDIDRWAKDQHVDAFEKDAQGNFRRKATRGQRQGRVIMFHSTNLMDVIATKMKRTGAKIINRVMVTHLLTSDGCYPTKGEVVGALGFDVRNGKFYLFKAPSVILASGSCSFKAIFIGVRSLTGDGTVAAYEAGAELKSMEFAVGHNTCPRHFDLMGLNMFVGQGGRFVNTVGEEFLHKYDPFGLENRCLQGTIAQAMASEVREGRGPIYMDLTHITDEQYLELKRVVPIAMMAVERMGMDVRKDKIEWAPAFKGNRGQPGGVRLVNHDCQSTIPGLFVLGDASDMPFYGSQENVLNFTFCFVGGYNAGKAAAERGRAVKRLEVVADQAASVKRGIYQPLELKGKGIDPDEVILRIQENIIPADICIFKKEDRLNEALKKQRDIEQQLVNKIQCKNIHQLVKANEARNMCKMAQLILTASLFRTESRGAHYREDYRERDDNNWLKWVMMKREGEEPRLWTEPVPIDRYNFKPLDEGGIKNIAVERYKAGLYLKEGKR